MELLEGVTLKTALKRDGAFGSARAMQVTKQICRSLREAHRLGIIHRDMKPGNVMLLEQGDEKDYVKVLDFGLVKDIEAEDEEDLTQAGVFMGSPKYMSPEQIQGERVDGRSDIYSVGVLLYEMLAGAPPFVREKQVQILMDHINAPVPPLPASVPPELAEVVEKCLAKKREDRFRDMDALLNALKVVAGELALPASAELGLSGDYPVGRTPVSGVHTLSGDPLRTTSSGSISAPTISGVSGAVPVRAEPAASRGGRTMAIILGGVALALAAAIALVLVDPFGAPEEATVPETAPSTPAPALPAVAAEPTAREPIVEPVLRSVIVELDSQPPGAMVHIGENEYGPTPAQVELTGALAEPGVELTFLFSVAGHRDTTVVRAVPASGSLEVSARLRRVVVRTPRRGGGSGETPGQAVTPAGYRDSPY
jgi:serine/threonine-protein kinase